MDFLKKYWYILILLCVTLGLGFITYLTSQQLAKKTPVAPTVPQQEPQAVEPACTLTFTLKIQTGECNTACSKDSDCSGGFVCSDEGLCRNSQCPLNQSCVCTEPSPTVTPGVTNTPVPEATVTPTPQPTNTPVPQATNTPVPEATNTPVPQATNTPVPTSTPVPPSSCNNICNVTADCASGLTCVDGACRNPSCTAETDCTCPVASNVSPTAPPAPKVPVSGSPSTLGFTAVLGGIFLLLIGMAL